jgi:hypothetical protein
MNDINKYLKIAKDAVIEPEEEIEEKIMDRISHLSKEDKDKILDENFRDFFKKSNSKLYQVEQKLRTHPGAFIFAGIFFLGVITLAVYVIRTIFSEDGS